MNTYVAELLLTNRHGGLEDRAVEVRAVSADEARAKVEAEYPAAIVGYVGPEIG